MSTKTVAWIFALTLALPTAAFVVGVTIEKNQEHSESTTEGHHSDEGAAAHESEEGGESHGADEGAESHESADDEGDESAEGHAEESEGESGESTPVVALGAVMSLALAGAALRWPRREVFAAAGLFCLAFAALDGRELLHQLDENSNTVATLAALALLLHLAAAGTAALGAVRTTHDSPGVQAA